MTRRGVPLVISAPSGGGKTTLCRRVMESLSDIEFSISYTTRDPRGQEQNGVDYHFVDESTFGGMVKDEKFLEWAEVHDRYYGTGLQQTQAKLAAGVDVLFDIDIQGGRQIASKMKDAVLVFVVPPNMAVLEQRLRGRGTDEPEVIDRRMRAARSEIEEASFYSYWIVNDDLDRATDELRAVILAERVRRIDNERLAKQLLGE